jgi:cytochrome c55X
MSMFNLATFSIALLLVSGPAGAEPHQVRQAELIHLLRHDCGSCHGMTLNGGLGPALTAAALEGKPRELLINTIMEGRPGTPMPPWRPMLSTEEAAWLVDLLLEGGLDAR